MPGTARACCADNETIDAALPRRTQDELGKTLSQAIAEIIVIRKYDK
jgi:hypothetical protein